MAHMSNYLENKLIDHIFRGASYTAPTTIAIALCTSAPTDTSTGATIAEVSNSNNYNRVVINPSSTNWLDTAGGTAGTSSGSTGTTSNGVTITFPTASGSWGTITHLAILDSEVYGAGNVLFWGALATSKTITDQDTFSFNTSNLSVQIDN